MGLEDLMIAEQFYQSLPDGLAVWLKDRKPASLKHMAELADDYMLSRKGLSTVQQADKSRRTRWQDSLVSSGGNGSRSTTNFHERRDVSSVVGMAISCKTARIDRRPRQQPLRNLQ